MLLLLLSCRDTECGVSVLYSYCDIYIWCCALSIYLPVYAWTLTTILFRHNYSALFSFALQQQSSSSSSLQHSVNTLHPQRQFRLAHCSVKTAERAARASRTLAPSRTLTPHCLVSSRTTTRLTLNTASAPTATLASHARLN